MTQIEIKCERPYSIHLGHGLLKNLPSYINLRGRRVLVVSDKNVAKWHLRGLMACLAGDASACFLDSLILAPGESKKNLASVEKIYRAMDKAMLNRPDLLISLGGGVIGDMAGFAAATWCRGLGLVQVPTSLLAMADSSVGGKTGFDYRGRKNGVGLFYQPEAVVADLDALKSLSPRHYSNGMAEIIKAGLIADPELLKACAQEQIDIEFALARALKVKADIVERDPKEKGERAFLNLGHTFGHAIESYFGYSRFLHGEAVSVGMSIACPGPELEAALARHGLPSKVSGLKAERLTAIILKDKKFGSGKMRFVRIKEPGKPYIEELSTEQLTVMAKEAIAKMDAAR